MNLPTGWQEAIASSPLLFVFLALIGVSLIVLFLAPFFFKLVRKAKFPARLGFIKRHPKRSLAVVLVVLVAVFGAYVYYYFNQPVQIVTAAQLKLEKGKAIKLTQQGPTGRDTARLYLLDVRTSQEYAVEHIKGSASLPVVRAMQGSISSLDVAIYSADPRFEDARKVADALIKNRTYKGKTKGEVGKIYVIRDGFEGLKKSGLITESGGWD